MSYNIPPNPQNLGPPPPGPQFDHTGSDAPPCTRCGHRDRSHLHAGRCSARGRWWRRCKCTGYIESDMVDPLY
jgi:hypothetical protein